MELYPRELSKEPAELFKTNDHTVNFNQFSLFEKLNEEYVEHFNHGKMPVKPKSFIREKPQKRSKCEHGQQGQNLKSVAMHIVKVLMTNHNITLKTLSHIIYEIMNKTELGDEIVEVGYPNLTAGVIRGLEEKYSRS